MYIDENLKWDVHIDKIIPKISAKISILRSLRNLVPMDTLTLMYNAIVLPCFHYADIVLDSSSAASKFKLQSVQTRAARLITGSGPRTSRHPMYKSLSWLSLQHRQDFHKCVIVYKCHNSLATSYLEKSNDTKYTYNTRHSSQLRSTKTEQHMIGASQYLGINCGMILHQPFKIAPACPLLRKHYTSFTLTKHNFKGILYILYVFNYIYICTYGNTTTLYV